MYTKAMFGYELKEKIQERQDYREIGIWAHTTYLEHCDDLEDELDQIMLDLNTMELGEEFRLSYKMLNKIADDLISGKEMDLNDKEYMMDDDEF